MNPRRLDGKDAGSITILGLGFAIIALLLILVGASATDLHLERTRLAHLADESALAAADALDLVSYYAGKAPRPREDAAVVLSSARMRAAVEDHVADHAADYGFERVEVVAVTSRDSHTVAVELRVRVHVLFGVDALLPWSDGIVLTATSSARAH